MNELSPGGTFLRPVTSNQQQQMRSYRSQWDDPSSDHNCSRPVVVNIRTVADKRSRMTFQQRSQEDVSRTSLPTFTKLKKNANATSDPRFKRVLNSGPQNDACVGTEASKSSPPENLNELSKLNAQAWNVADSKTKENQGGAAGTKKDCIKNSFFDGTLDYSNVATVGSDSVQENLKVDKFSYNQEIVQNTFPKKTVSDCTINTTNTSLVSEDLKDDYAERFHTFSSTTRVRKVQNWIAEQKPKLDKRQSVITVIGQTQGHSALSSAFHEIDQRRKLVKELDRYAICNKITDSCKDKEINTLVAQINFLSPSGKLLYSGNKKFGLKSVKYKMRPCSKYQEAGDGISKHFDLNYNDGIRSGGVLITDQDTSISHSSQPSSTDLKKEAFFKCWDVKYDIRGKIRHTICRVPNHWLPYIMVIISGLLCWYTFIVLQKNGFVWSDLFPQKPKTLTWYEKICYWLWEIFRPSAVSVYSHCCTLFS